MSKTKVVLVQLGSPKSPSTSDVRGFLREFLKDPRVVDLSPFIWKLILYLFVLPFRPKRSAKAYSRIWDGESFPLITNTEKFARKVAGHMPSDIEVNHAFLLASPRPIDIFREWENEDELTRAKKVLVLPQFPQYSESTIASGIDGLGETLKELVTIPKLEVLDHYHRSKAFIDNSAHIVLEYWKKGEFDHLVFSFHGIPKRRVIQKKDPYYRHCYETYWLLVDKLQSEIAKDKTSMTFQSRFGSEEWLTPYTDEYVEKLIISGSKKILVYCPAFVVDCLETTDEIGTELGEDAHRWGGEVTQVPCLNDNDTWAKDYADFVKTLVKGSAQEKEELYYKVESEKLRKTMPEVSMKSPPMSKEAKSSIKIIFLVLFLDLMGFSIIFPMFPAMAEYYLSVDSENIFLRTLFGGISSLTDFSDGNYAPIVLFGGALGAIYSFLQFLMAPFWGSLSDRLGRKPVLMISLIGLLASYGLWFFAGSFTILILGRFLGGVMAGNISTATAVIADVTTPANRSKGMAFVGIAFALGFILGPAVGGFSTLWNISETFPLLKNLGVNPFSFAALIAFVLTAANIIWVYRKFEETLPPEKRGKGSINRTSNPFKLFRKLPFEGVNLVNWGHFLFLMAFSGMEFTLTFLAVERLSFTPMDNGWMFVFIGFLIAMVQGGYVRRKAGQIGEKRMALQGLIFIIPGLLATGFAQSTWLLYVGLFFLAVGSAMVIPCLTSLVSLFAPSDRQGEVIGVFRSLGALARVIGPILACLVYWKLGSGAPYFFGAAFLLIPIIMIARVKQESS